ncbi:5'-3' exonuclease H3TH domain-containing protein [Lysinibacillus sp. fkY74-1]|nr:MULTISPECIES: 5'-3' exonuclease [Lysinibacillus]MBE5084418.1 5'-3' exonuclease [Bacillus thuringiensis]MBI6862801.1 5'-3' exonuclease [Lysinibacillus fusiformis]MCS1395483.1 5'-3' exonuclease [Lysinibacillus sp. PB211]MDM5352350.1 5'-3' exonuclease [Lysinibacillus sphaericus]MDR0160192.1 5'-3' exonuclease [Lysinibacillus sphaericus]
MTTKPKLLIVDGMALLFRSFFASAAMGHFIRLADGTPTNGAQGFVRHVLTAQSLMKPTHMAVCWDMGAHTFRNELFDGYKANRPAPPEEMLPQFDMAKNLSLQMGWQNFGVKGMEADDLIGSMIAKWQDDADITVISGDKDLLQLLRPSTEIAFMKKGYTEYDIYTHGRFKEEYSIEPAQFAQVKAFMGDTSDGYPGVKGIGPKQALTLIQTYGSIDSVLASLGELKPGQRTKIQDQIDMLKLSHELATIQTDVPIEADLSSLVLPNYEPQIFKEMEESGYTLIAKHARSLYSLI